MRKAIGPILTTGVALGAAAVVVANPVAPLVRDLQISTTQLSTSPEALIPFDKNLLNSISPTPAASNFSAALAQILGALAAEADRISSEVNSAAGIPVVPSAAATTPTPPAPTPVSGDVRSGATPNRTPAASVTVLPALVAASTPVLQQVVADITADTAYLGNKVVEAASAAVNAIVNTPNLIFKAVQAILLGDLKSAFEAVVDAIKAFFDPGLILVGGIDNVVGQYGLHLGLLAPSASAAAARDGQATTSPDTAVGDAEESATDPETSTAAEPGSDGRQDAPKTGGGNRAASKVRRAAEPASTDATSPAEQPPSTPGSSSGAAGAPGTARPITGLTNEIQKNRSIVDADLTGGPGVATSPIPTIPPPLASAHAAAGKSGNGPVTKVTDSVKAVPAPTASASGDNSPRSSADASSDAASPGSSAPAP